MNNRKSFIVVKKSTKLSTKEKYFLKDTNHGVLFYLLEILKILNKLLI